MCSVKTILSRAIMATTDKTLSKLSMRGVTGNLGSILANVVDNMNEVELFTEEGRPSQHLTTLALDIKDILENKIIIGAVESVVQTQMVTIMSGLIGQDSEPYTHEEYSSVLVLDMLNAVREVKETEKGYASTSRAKAVLSILYVIADMDIQQLMTVLESVQIEEEESVVDAEVVIDTQDTVEEDTVEVETVEDDTVEDDIVEEDTVEIETVEEDTIEEDTVEEDAIEEDTVEIETVEEDTIEEDAVEEDTTILIEEEEEKVNMNMAIKDQLTKLRDNNTLSALELVKVVKNNLDVNGVDVLVKAELNKEETAKYKRDIEVVVNAAHEVLDETEERIALFSRIVGNNNALRGLFEETVGNANLVSALISIFALSMDEEPSDPYINLLRKLDEDTSVMDRCALSNYASHTGAIMLSKELTSTASPVHSIERIITAESMEEEDARRIYKGKEVFARDYFSTTERIETFKSASRLVSADMLEHLVSLRAESKVVQGLMYFCKESNNMISVKHQNLSKGKIAVGYTNTSHPELDEIELLYVKENVTMLARETTVVENLILSNESYTALTLPQEINHDGLTFELHAAISLSSDQQRLSRETQGMTYINLKAFNERSTAGNLLALQEHMRVNTHGLTELQGMAEEEGCKIVGSAAKSIATRLTPLSTASITGKITGYIVYTQGEHKQHLEGAAGNDGISYLTNALRNQLGLRFSEGLQTRPLSAKALSTFVNHRVAVEYANSLVRNDQKDTVIAYYEDGVVVDAFQVSQAKLAKMDVNSKEYKIRGNKTWKFLGSFDGNVLKYGFTPKDVIGSKFEICSSFSLDAKGTDKLSYQVIDLLNIDEAWLRKAKARLEEVIKKGAEDATFKAGELRIEDYVAAKERYSLLVKKVQETFRDGKIFVDPKLNKNAIIQPEIMGSLGFDIFQFLSDEHKTIVENGHIPVFTSAFDKTEKGISMRYPILAGEVMNLLILHSDDAIKMINAARKHVKKQLQDGEITESRADALLAALNDCEKQYKTKGLFVPLVGSFMNLLGGWDTDKDSLLISIDPMLVDHIREVRGTDSTFADTNTELYEVNTSKYFASINLMMFQNQVMADSPSVGAITKNSEICTKMIRAMEDMIKYNNTNTTPDGDVQKLIEETVASLSAFMEISQNAYDHYTNEKLRSDDGQIAKAIIDVTSEENFLNQKELIKLDKIVDDGHKSTKKDVVKEVVSYTQTNGPIITCCEETYTNNEMLANIVETLKKIRSVYTFDQGAAIDIIKRNLKIEDKWINLFCDIKSNPKAAVTKNEEYNDGITSTTLSRKVPNVRGNADLAIGSLINHINSNNLLSFDGTGKTKDSDIVESGQAILSRLARVNKLSASQAVAVRGKFLSFGYTEQQFTELYSSSVYKTIKLARDIYASSYNHIEQNREIDNTFQAEVDRERLQTKGNIEICRAILTRSSQGVNSTEFIHALYADSPEKSKFARKMADAPLSKNPKSEIKNAVAIKLSPDNIGGSDIKELTKGMSEDGFVFGTNADRVKLMTESHFEEVYTNGKIKIRLQKVQTAYTLGDAEEPFNANSEIESAVVFEYTGALDCKSEEGLRNAMSSAVLRNNVSKVDMVDGEFTAYGESITSNNVTIIEKWSRGNELTGVERQRIGSFIIIKKMK